MEKKRSLADQIQRLTRKRMEQRDAAQRQQLRQHAEQLRTRSQRLRERTQQAIKRALDAAERALQAQQSDADDRLTE